MTLLHGLAVSRCGLSQPAARDCTTQTLGHLASSHTTCTCASQLPKPLHLQTSPYVFGDRAQGLGGWTTPARADLALTSTIGVCARIYASCAFLARASSSARLFPPVRSLNMPRCTSIDRGMVTARTTSHGPVKLMPKAETHKISLITPTIMIRLEYHNCTTTMI